MRVRIPTTAMVAALTLLAACDEATRPGNGPGPSLASTGSATSAIPTGRAVVVFASDSSIPAAGLTRITALGGVVTARHDGIGVVFVNGLGAAALQALAGDALVEEVGPDYALNWLPGVRLGPVVQVSDAAPAGHDPEKATRFTSWQWGPQRIAAHEAWRAGYVGSPVVKVAILDTGIDALNRELRGLVDTTLSRSFVETEPTYDDFHFHGTHVASTVATNSVTIAGIAPHVTLIGVKVLSFQGSGSFEGVIGGIMYAADIGANVINMSLGAEFDKRLDGAKALIKAMQRAVKYAGKQNTLVISAAGNSAINLDDAGAPIVAMPCMASHICVSATGPLNGQFDAAGPILTANHDQPAVYTNYGFSAVTVAAPGGNFNPDDPDRSQGTWRQEDLIAGACAGRSLEVPQCAANNDLVAFYLFAAGTSMATPHVSGAAALISSQYGGLISHEALKQRLIAGAEDVGTPGKDIYTNHGRINVMRALQSN